MISYCPQPPEPEKQTKKLFCLCFCQEQEIEAKEANQCTDTSITSKAYQDYRISSKMFNLSFDENSTEKSNINSNDSQLLAENKYYLDIKDHTVNDVKNIQQQKTQSSIRHRFQPQFQSFDQKLPGSTKDNFKKDKKSNNLDEIKEAFEIIYEKSDSQIK